MNWNVTHKGIVEKFPGSGGWVYVLVPEKFMKELKENRVSWGMYPITVTLGSSTWKTKLMTKKGGGFFVALKAHVRKKEAVEIGDVVKLYLSAP